VTPRRLVGDIPLALIALALSLMGLAMVYSAGVTDVPSYVAGLYKQQAMWFGIGLATAYLLTRTSVRFIQWMTWPVYLLSLVLLMALLVVGTGAGTAAGTKSWLAIGGVRVGQPAEFAKITVVLALAHVLAVRREPPRSLLDLWKPALVVGIPWLLIMAQPDLGSAIAFIGIFFAMLYWSGVAWPLLLLLVSPAVSLILSFSTGLWGAWFLVLVALVLWYKPYLVEGVALMVMNVATGVLAPLMWERLKPYQQNRLRVFLNPEFDPRAAGYHVIQSKVAIGSGGLFGEGYTAGSQKRLAFLPEQHTDFIWAVVGEELGFLGVTIGLILFTLLLLRTIRIAARANDTFASLAAYGIMAAWLTHIIVNIGMTLNLLPITGIPLPFFSYGGSFMLASWIGIGILLRIAGEGRGKAGGILG
jgi:rod shape determining protein RodA